MRLQINCASTCWPSELPTCGQSRAVSAQSPPRPRRQTTTSVQSQQDSLIRRRSFGLRSRYCGPHESPIQHAHNCTIRAFIGQLRSDRPRRMRGRALDAVNGWCAAQASSRRKNTSCYSFGAITMKILATLPAKGRDLRLDLFRGVANWDLPGPYPQQHRELGDNAKLRLQ